MDQSIPDAGAAVDHATINLALQGGGSHGAFTWGVLDTLLADPRIDFEGISGTSAGAMNAVALAHGFAQAAQHPKRDAREAARESLANFWGGIIDMGALSEVQKAPFELLFGSLGAASPTADWLSSLGNIWAQSLSPYDANPFDINPLRSFLQQQVDFDALAQLKSLKVFVVATRVTSGQAEVFSGKRLTADAVMASACLPMAFRAVEIDGEHYWDGGYSGNPAIHPLLYNCKGRDIVLVQINPIRRPEIPRSSAQIMDRVNEITFNAGLIAEMRAIDFVKRLIADGKLSDTQYKDVLMHRIDGGESMDAYAASTKVSTGYALIHALRDLGVECARTWLAKKYRFLGVQSSVNIKHDYLDDLRVPVSNTGKH